MRLSFSLSFFLVIFTACSNPKNDPDEKKIISDKSKVRAEKDSVGVFKWETDLCEFENTFNARIYTLEELKGTLELLNMVGALKLEVRNTAFTPDQINDLSSLEELDSEYRKKRKALQNLEIVKDPFWQDVKRLMLQEMKDEYDLDRIGMQAYTNPNALKGNRFSQICPDIVTALTGKDTALIISTWKALVEEQCKKNASPDYLMKKFEVESNDPERMMYARVELITFGWHNRVNAAIPNLRHDEKLNKKFDQLFLKTHAECDEC
jgi:hypothetical protein